MKSIQGNASLAAASIISSVLLTACPTPIYSLRAGELAPALANVAPEARVAVWQHAVVVLLDQGYVPQILNESAGYISARRRDDLVDDALSGTSALVTVSPDGVVRVAIAGSGAFATEEQFRKAMSDRQHLLEQLIVAPPGTVAAPRQ